MKILIYDTNRQDLAHLCNLIQNLPLDVDMDTASDFNQGANLYHANKYEVIFIDFAVNGGKKFLADVLKNDAHQRIITISKVIECSEMLGCDYCLEHYNKKRILKPITQDEVIDIFSNKEYPCPKYAGVALFMKLKQIEKIVKQSYTNFTLDTEKLIFIDHGQHHYDNDFFTIIEKLTQYSIKHTVDENGNIKVLP